MQMSLHDSQGPKGVPYTAAGHRPDRVVVLNDLAFAKGGATGVALASVEYLRRSGVPVTLITGEDASVNLEALADVDVVSVGGRHILDAPRSAAGLQGLYNRDTFRVVRRWIEANDTPNTVYHLHGWSKILSPSVFHALRPVARRLAVTAHDYFLVCPNGGYFDFQNSRPCERKPMGMSCLTHHCDRRSYAHKAWRSLRQALNQYLGELHKDKVSVLAVHEGMIPHLEHGGIQRSQIRTLRNPVTPWRSERVVAESNKTFLFVGRLEPDKGIDLLAEAAVRANVPLRVIGQGPLADMLSSRYPTVELAGWKSRAEIAELITDARALVMPSRWRETFGLAALEGLMSGLPVIASKYAMISQDVVAGGFGLSSDPFDVEDLSSALLRIAHDDDLTRAMSQHAYEHAHRLAYSPEAWTTALLNVYGDMLGARQPREASEFSQALLQA